MTSTRKITDYNAPTPEILIFEKHWKHTINVIRSQFLGLPHPQKKLKKRKSIPWFENTFT